MMENNAPSTYLECRTNETIMGSYSISKDAEERKDADDDDGDANDTGGVLFIRKLYEMVSKESDEILSFQVDGSSFEVS
jgi:hypothetical protein